LSILKEHREEEEKARQEAIALLREQMELEGKLVGLYEKTAPTIENRPVRHLLHMIELDSRKHIDICQTVIEVLEGEDVFSEHKEELVQGLKDHIEMEEGAIQRAEILLKNVWIRENKALSELIKKLRDDEKHHTAALKKLSEKPFFRFRPGDFTVVFRGEEFAEDRYRREKAHRMKKE
jgi:rubrerythrin